MVEACVTVGAVASLAAWASGQLAAVEVGPARTISGLGAIQGASVIDGRIVLYGDAETGMLRTFDRDLNETAPTIALTRVEEDLLPHPTGLAHHPGIGTFFGDTVRRTGIVYVLDWERATAGGTLIGPCCMCVSTIWRSMARGPSSFVLEGDG